MTCFNDRMAAAVDGLFYRGFIAGKKEAWQNAIKIIRAAYKKGLADGKKTCWIRTVERMPIFFDHEKTISVLYINVDDAGNRYWVKSRLTVDKFLLDPNHFDFWLDENKLPLPELSQT